MRKVRAERIQKSADVTQKVLHLQDGPEQKERDEAMRRAWEREGRNPDLWADEGWQRFMWGVDAVRETVKEWDRWERRVEKGGRDVAML